MLRLFLEFPVEPFKFLLGDDSCPQILIKSGTQAVIFILLFFQTGDFLIIADNCLQVCLPFLCLRKKLFLLQKIVGIAADSRSGQFPQHGFFYAVAAASLPTVLGGADIVDLFRPFVAVDPSHHLLLAVPTEQEPHERADFFFLRADAAVRFQKVLYDGKIIGRYNGLVGILHSYPFFCRFLHAFLYLIVNPLCPALHQMAQVHFVGQYPPDGRAAPLGSAAPGKASPKVQSQGFLILPWGQDVQAVELFCDGRNSHPLNLPCKDPADNARRIIVHQQPVSLLRRFPIAVHGKSRKAFPFSAFDRKLAFYLGGNITAIAVVDEIFYRQYDIALPGVRRKTVVLVRDGDKAHPQGREYLIQIPPGLNIIAPETGQVFHNDAVYPARFDVA